MSHRFVRWGFALRRRLPCLPAQKICIGQFKAIQSVLSCLCKISYLNLWRRRIKKKEQKKTKNKPSIWWNDFFFCRHWILLKPLKYWVLKVCVRGASSFHFLSPRRMFDSVVYAVTLFQLLQLRANDIKLLVLDVAVHLHQVWRSISPEMQLHLRQSVWILMAKGK